MVQIIILHQFRSKLIFQILLPCLQVLLFMIRIHGFLPENTEKLQTSNLPFTNSFFSSKSCKPGNWSNYCKRRNVHPPSTHSRRSQPLNHHTFQMHPDTEIMFFPFPNVWQDIPLHDMWRSEKKVRENTWQDILLHTKVRENIQQKSTSHEGQRKHSAEIHFTWSQRKHSAEIHFTWRFEKTFGPDFSSRDGQRKHLAGFHFVMKVSEKFW